MEEYNRGDVIQLEKARITQEIIKRGENAEELFNSNGWKDLAKTLQVFIDNHRRNIDTKLFQRENIDKLMDASIVVQTYEMIMGLPREFILMKEDKINGRGK